MGFGCCLILPVIYLLLSYIRVKNTYNNYIGEKLNFYTKGKGCLNSYVRTYSLINQEENFSALQVINYVVPRIKRYSLKYAFRVDAINNKFMVTIYTLNSIRTIKCNKCKLTTI